MGRRKNGQYLFYIVAGIISLLLYLRWINNKEGFDDIYIKFQSLTHIDNYKLNNIKEIEIITEINNIMPIMSNINKVKDGDILVSDMYLSKNDIKRLLNSAGFNKNVIIYVTPGGKSSGTIWKKLLDVYNINSHTGDNEHSDINMAKQNNITINQQNQLLNEKLKLLESVNINNTKLLEQNNLLSDKIIELEHVKTENNKLVQQLNTLNDKIKILDDLQITNIKLNKEVNTNNEIIKNQMSRLAELESVYEINQKLKEQNSRLNDEINDLKLENRKISNKLNDINEQYERLQNKLLIAEKK